MGGKLKYNLEGKRRVVGEWAEKRAPNSNTIWREKGE
jgi:hypothetical protein